MSLLPISIFGYNHHKPPLTFDDFYDEMEYLFPPPPLAALTNGGGCCLNSLFGLPPSRPADDRYLVKLNIGHYKPEEIAVTIEDNKLLVNGNHRHNYGNGHETSNFSRTYDIPSEVMKETITHRVTENGLLMIEGKKKQPEKRQFCRDLSTTSQFNVAFDVQGFKPDEVKVSLNGRELVVEGNHQQTTSNEDGGRFSEQKKSFYKVITLQPDVVVDSVQPKMTKDGYLYLVGKRDVGLLKSQMKQLKILPE